MTELEILVDCVNGAARREHLADRFDDDRNLDAARLLNQLALGVAALNGSAVHRRIETFRPDINHLDHPFYETIEAVLRDVGFRLFPRNAEELLARIVETLERECEPGKFLKPVS